MKQPPARTVAEYLAALPEDRRKSVSRVRAMVRKHLPKGYVEVISWGAISYEIPLKRYPDTYNGQPLSFAGIASQKNHIGLYLMCAYMDPACTKQLHDAFAKAGKRLDMGKSCIRFRTAADLPLPAIGKIIAGIPVADYIARYETVRAKSGRGR